MNFILDVVKPGHSKKHQKSKKEKPSLIVNLQSLISELTTKRKGDNYIHTACIDVWILENVYFAHK